MPSTSGYTWNTDISQHYNATEFNGDELVLRQIPVLFPAEKVPDEIMEFKTDLRANNLYDEKSFMVLMIWPLMNTSYPKVTEKTRRTLIPFIST